MLRLAFVLSLFCLYPSLSRAGADLILDGAYLYSTLNNQSASSFSMVGNNGWSGRGELSLGGTRWDFVASGELKNAKLMAPASKTVEGAKVQSGAYAGGLRLKSSFVWLRLSYNARDSLFLENTGTNLYTLHKIATPFYSMDIHFFGQGRGYQLGVDVEGFYPASTVATVAGDLKYQYAGRGSVRIEFGSGKARVGIQSGIETHQYSVASDKYFRTEFFGGLTFGFAFSGGRSSGGRSNYGGEAIPAWPIK